MSRYEQRLATDKVAIRDGLVAVGRLVEAAVIESVEGVLRGDHAAGYQIVLGDLSINRQLRAIDRQCHAFVARHLPSAGHLRFVSSALKMVVELERVGDYAATIAREGIQLSEPPPELLAQLMHECARDACDTLSHALTAFAESDAKLARASKPKPGQKCSFERAFRTLIASTDTGIRVQDLFGLRTIFYKLERVSDQAKNICEETLFELLSETKPPKRYQVLFVDARDTLLGPLACAIARKAYPESGDYFSAGWAAGSKLAPELDQLAKDFGLDLDDKRPSPLPSQDALTRFHVIVALAAGAHQHLPAIPRKSIFIEWSLPSLSEVDHSGIDVRLREVVYQLTSDIEELLTALHGEGAK